MQAKITGGTDGADFEPITLVLTGDFVADYRIISKALFMHLTDSVGDTEAGSRTQECMESLCSQAKDPGWFDPLARDVAWVSSVPAGSMGESVPFWVAVILVKEH